jgi:hypothetical protein
VKVRERPVNGSASLSRASSPPVSGRVKATNPGGRTNWSW